MSNTIKIAIADDHRLFREGLIKLLDNYKDIKVVIAAENGRELLNTLNTVQEVPDVCVLDINMPVMRGFEAAKQLKKSYPTMGIIALSMYDDESKIIRMIRSGANGYLLKDCMPSVLVDAIKEVYENGIYHSDVMTDEVLSQSRADVKDKHKLSNKELTFLNLASTDRTYKAIADEMGLSERTIDGYRDKLFHKFHVRSRVGLVMEALRHGHIQLEAEE